MEVVPTPAFWTVRQAAVHLGEGVRTFYRRVASGQYPPLIKNGRRSQVLVEWVKREVARRVRESGR